MEDLDLGGLRSVLVPKDHQELREDGGQEPLEFRGHGLCQRLDQADDGEPQLVDLPQVARELKHVLEIVADVAADDRDEERELLQVEVAMFPRIRAAGDGRERRNNLYSETR